LENDHVTYVIPTTHHISKIPNREPQTHENSWLHNSILSFLFEVEKIIEVNDTVIIQIPYPNQG